MPSDFSDKTMMFKVQAEEVKLVRDIVYQVYNALVEKGYNPINQLVGYLLSVTRPILPATTMPGI